MTITRVGSNEKYAAGWSKAFGGKAKKSAAAGEGKKPAGRKKAAKKKAKKA